MIAKKTADPRSKRPLGASIEDSVGSQLMPKLELPETLLGCRAENTIQSQRCRIAAIQCKLKKLNRWSPAAKSEYPHKFPSLILRL